MKLLWLFIPLFFKKKNAILCLWLFVCLTKPGVCCDVPCIVKALLMHGFKSGHNKLFRLDSFICFIFPKREGETKSPWHSHVKRCQ